MDISASSFHQNSLIDSNIYIHARSTGTRHAGTVVNYYMQGSIVHSNSLFIDGKAHNTGGVSFLGEFRSDTTSLSIKFCFFMNNYDLNGNPREIYFDQSTSSKASQNAIIQSFSLTPGSTVYYQNNPSQGNDWLFLYTLSYLITPMQ